MVVRVNETRGNNHVFAVEDPTIRRRFDILANVGYDGSMDQKVGLGVGVDFVVIVMDE